MDAAAGGKLRAWLEALRAPLLLSPVADVLAGYAFARGVASQVQWLGDAPAPAPPADMALAVVAAVCLLAGGMAQNAVADVEDDRLRKPGRPIARGALRRGTVLAVALALHAAALAAAAAVSPGLFATAALIVAGASLYHVGLKRWRIAGCLVLGALRGLDLWLGVLLVFPARGVSRALAALVDAPFMWAAWAYALYVFAAALFASTDDEESPSTTLRGFALGLSTATLFGMVALSRRLGGAAPAAAAWLALGLLVWAWLRVLRARPVAPRMSGALLSNAYLVTAAIAAGTGPWPLGTAVAGAAIALFLVSRLALRIVPPS